MRVTPFPSSELGYAHAVAVDGPGRLLFLSGQVPVGPDGTVPDGLEAQTRVAFANVEARLAAAGMTLAHLVKLTAYVPDRATAHALVPIATRILGGPLPAVTGVMGTMFEASWLIEIDAIAAGPAPEETAA